MEDYPWTDALIETSDYAIFKDAFPVTEGHLLFVPKEKTWEKLAACYEAAYRWGCDWVDSGYSDGYNIGQNVGQAAGQTVMYPHVHLIPRRQGDMEDPRGGVRHVIPQKGNYRLIDMKTLNLDYKDDGKAEALTEKSSQSAE